MTVFHIAQSQYRDKSNGTVEGVRVYFESLSYHQPTSIDSAMVDFVQRHAESDDAKEGWKLIGISKFLMIDLEVYKSYEGLVDDGVVTEMKEVVTKPARPYLTVIK
jgi:hypothetical protein